MVVVLGSTGYIGSAFIRALKAREIPHCTVARGQVDHFCADSLARHLKAVGASFVVNAAGFTGRPNVDACESKRAECLLANCVLPDRVRQACDQAGIRWGHVSSGCIYQGRPTDRCGFAEYDPPNFSFRSEPCSFYSGTKAMAEELLLTGAPVYLWRLRMPFCSIPHPKNYLTKLLSYDRLLQATNSLSNVDEFVNACIDCWTMRIPEGIYNLTNSGSISTLEIVSLIKEVLRPNKTFRYFASEAEFMESAAIAPRSNCVLDNSKALSYGLRLSDTRQAIVNSLKKMASWGV